MHEGQAREPAVPGRVDAEAGACRPGRRLDGRVGEHDPLLLAGGPACGHDQGVAFLDWFAARDRDESPEASTMTEGRIVSTSRGLRGLGKARVKGENGVAFVPARAAARRRNGALRA